MIPVKFIRLLGDGALKSFRSGLWWFRV